MPVLNCAVSPLPQKDKQVCTHCLFVFILFCLRFISCAECTVYWKSVYLGFSIHLTHDFFSLVSIQCALEMPQNNSV
jgi:hypothetical protein